MKSTIQETFIENINSGVEAGITFIEGNRKTDYLSYKKLYLEACYKLHALNQAGLNPGDELVFQFESNKNFVITFWACVFGKITPVPVAYASSQDTISKICGVWKTLKNPYVISDNIILKSYLEQYEGDEKQVFNTMLERFINYDDLAMSRREKPLEQQPEDLVFVQFSSGSTGFPKGVTNTNEAILYNINNYIKYLDVDQSDRFLGWVPLTHDMGLIFFHIFPLLTNSNQYLMPPSLFLTFPELLMEGISEHEITISGSPNFGYRLILENLERINKEKLKLDKLRIMLNSAEPVSIAVCKEFAQAFEDQGLAKESICPGYGLAEAVLGVSLCHDKVFDEYLIDRGRLNIGDEVEMMKVASEHSASFANAGTFDGTEIKITDRDGNQLPDDQLGFIHLRSKAITRGFYNNEEATREAISADGWLNTGDIGFLNNNNLIITGREKEMILINGQNFFPNDVDTLLEEIPEIKFQQAISCNVFNHDIHSDEIYVFLHYKGTVEDFIPIMLKIRRLISLNLGIRVAKVVAVPAIPKTTSGKPQRYVLRDNYLSGQYDEFLQELNKAMNIIKENHKRLTLNQVEQKVLNIVSLISGIKDALATTNFFDLGFTSIKTVQLKVAIEEQFMEKVDDVVLFKYTNTRDLAKYVYTDVLQNQPTGRPTNETEFNMDSAKSRMGRLLKASI